MTEIPARRMTDNEIEIQDWLAHDIIRRERQRQRQRQQENNSETNTDKPTK